MENGKVKVAIFGAGKFGEYLLHTSAQSSEYEFVYFCDNYVQTGKELPILSPERIREKVESGEINQLWVALTSLRLIEEIILQLHEQGVFSVRVVDPRVWTERIDIFNEFELEKYVKGVRIVEKAFLSMLEYHVCDHCNLNCTGCAHFAPIFKESFSDFPTFKKDIEQLQKKFEMIFRFRLMGGEPFLHKDLDKFIHEVRNAFPSTNLEIVTNGLLLHKVEERIWKSIKENCAVLHISLYPPTFAKKEMIEEELKKKEIEYKFVASISQDDENGVIKEFGAGLTTQRVRDYRNAAVHCIMGESNHFLKDGKLARCVVPLIANNINTFFDTDFQVEEADYVDLYSDKRSPWDIVKQLHDATPFCGYCSSKEIVKFPWSVKREICIEDYIIKENETIDGKL